MWELTSLTMNYLISLLTLGYTQVGGQVLLGGGGWAGGALPVLSYRGGPLPAQGLLPVPGIVQPASTTLLQNLIQPQLHQQQQHLHHQQQQQQKHSHGSGVTNNPTPGQNKETKEEKQNSSVHLEEESSGGLDQDNRKISSDSLESKVSAAGGAEGKSKVRIGIQFPLAGVEKQIAGAQSEQCCDSLTSNIITLSKDSLHQEDQEEQQEEQEEESSNTVEDFETEIISGNVKCVKKIMMEEKYEYDTEVTCDHSYSKTCYTSLVTTYKPSQEEECQEDYVKDCFIDYNKDAVETSVVVCRKEMEKVCGGGRSGIAFPLPGVKIQEETQSSPASSSAESESEGEEECTTHYQTECVKRSEEHQVTEDSPVCQTVEEVKCEDSRDNSTCVSWPRQECSIERREVTRLTPTTECTKLPVELCGPPGCSFRESEREQCEDKKVTLVQDRPAETCDIQPRRVCKFVTKLVPRLEEVEQCTDVPQEVCTKNRGAPRKVKQPVVKKWCYHVKQETSSTGTGASYGRNF